MYQKIDDQHPVSLEEFSKTPLGRYLGIPYTASEEGYQEFLRTEASGVDGVDKEQEKPRGREFI